MPKLEFEEKETLFVEVILPLAVSKNYTYRVPFELNEAIGVGKRVIVQFGKNKIYAAIIKSISTLAPTIYQAKYIIDIIDNQPIVTSNQLLFWDWVADYYLCTQGEVMNAALPNSLKLASETVLLINPDVDLSNHNFTEKENILVQFLLKSSQITIDKIANLVDQKSVYSLVNRLIAKEVVTVLEQVVEKYKPLTKSFLVLDEFYKEENNLRQLFDLFSKKTKQLEVLLAYQKLAREDIFVSKERMITETGVSSSAIKSLVDKQIFRVVHKSVSRLTEAQEQISLDFVLSETQKKAFHQIIEQFERKDVVLLHGETSSGKTQLYIKIIEKMIEEGQQVLFLLPEIALTTQIVERIKIYFGDKIGVYHSKFNNNERVEIWEKVLNGTYKVILGARSSVFLPFQNLKLIVIDEEHESSYKQQDPAPRYQARDAAIYLANQQKAKVLLGSATPSLESYYNALNEKYGLVVLNERFGGVQLPIQTVVSIAEETKKKTMQSYFTSVLINDIHETLQNNEQVILFQNRRGYATILICKICGFAPKCEHCDVSLTYHKSSGKLHCHYCGYYQNSLIDCPACGSVHIEQKGFGTERIEEELSLIFPDKNIARLDLDSTRRKLSFQKIISDFQEKKTHILIGTQMVAKGLDFDNVTLIGVINADTLLNFPDFRAFERSYQLLAQVAGRAGRREKQGRVIIQAYDTNHRIIHQVTNNLYLEMYEKEIAERKEFKYPPFSRLIFLNIKHKELNILNQAAKNLATSLVAQLGDRVLGPQQPLVGKIRNYYILQIILKIEKEVSIKKVKDILVHTLHHFNTDKNFKGTREQIDVDPY